MHRFLALIACVVVAAVSGCGAAGRGGPAESVEAIAHDVAAGRAAAVWEALPASWQADVTGVVHGVAGKLDRDVYDKAFGLLGKVDRLLREKKQYILGSAGFRDSGLDRGEIDRNWDAMSSILKSITASDVRTLDGLGRLDVGRFLAKTGTPVWQQMTRLVEAADDPEVARGLDAMRTLEAKTLSQEGDSATVAVTMDGETNEVEMTRVEGKWVPADMAREWDGMIAGAGDQVVGIDLAGSKVLVMQALGVADATLDVLLAARSQEDFDRAIEQASLSSMFR